MRGAGLALLASTFGCNAIFGIGLSQPWDAGGPIDGPDFTGQITWQTLGSAGITFDAIDGLDVSIGALDGSGTMTVAVGSNGQFTIPRGLGLGPTRVVFTTTAGGTFKTEIQSALQGFTYAIPSFGRHDATRELAGSNAVFAGSAAGVTTAYTGERLVTTGLWAVEDAPMGSGSNGAFSFPYSSATSLSGPLGVPQASQGDAEVVLFENVATTNGFAVFTAEGLGSPVSGTYGSAAPISVTVAPGNTGGALNRIPDALGALSPSNGPNALLWTGVIPSMSMPGFAEPLTDAGSLTAVGAPPPVLLPLDENGTAMFTFQDPFDGTHGVPSLPVAAYACEFATRKLRVGGGYLYLTTAVQGISLVDAATATADESAGLAESTLGAPATFNGTQLISDTTDITPISLTGSTVPLQFSVDAAVDDCMATLFVVTAAGLVPVSRYIAIYPTSQTLTIDVAVSDFMDKSDTFVFGVQCELGHSIMNNDYTVPKYPVSMSSTFLPTFTVN